MRSLSPNDRSSSKGKGFTLLEVLLALCILLLSLVALANLSFVGFRAATRSELLSEGTWHAYSVLQEMEAGIRRKDLSGPQSLDSEWMFSIAKYPTEMAGLSVVEVQVWRTEGLRQPQRVTLSKMMYDREP